MDYTTLLQGLGIILGRHALGFFITAYRDKKITKYEWKQGATTLGVIAGISLALYFGLPDIGFTAITGMVAGGDMILSEVKQAFGQ